MKRVRPQSAFSLVELIAAIAVLAILAAIVIPVAGNVRAQARAGACLVNLRQIGTGLQLYLNDHDDRFPEMAAARASVDEPEPSLDTVLLPYLEDPQTFACPADNRGIASTSGTSYYWNSALNGQRLSSLDFLTITDPTRIPVVADKERFHGRTVRPVNYLYADGHSRKDLRLFTE